MDPQRAQRQCFNFKLGNCRLGSQCIFGHSPSGLPISNPSSIYNLVFTHDTQHETNIPLPTPTGALQR